MRESPGPSRSRLSPCSVTSIRGESSTWGAGGRPRAGRNLPHCPVPRRFCYVMSWDFQKCPPSSPVPKAGSLTGKREGTRNGLTSMAAALLQRRAPSLSPKPPRFAARRGRGSRSRLNVTVTSGDGKKNSRRPGLPLANGAGSSDFSIGKARVILMSGRGRQGRLSSEGLSPRSPSVSL